jgi:hypothetical protein
MDFQKTLFLKKWNKSLKKSKTVFAGYFSECGNKLFLTFEPIKSRAFGGAYTNKIYNWCTDNNIECDIIDACPIENNTKHFIGLYVTFNH